MGLAFWRNYLLNHAEIFVIPSTYLESAACDADQCIKTILSTLVTAGTPRWFSLPARSRRDFAYDAVNHLTTETWFNSGGTGVETIVTLAEILDLSKREIGAVIRPSQKRIRSYDQKLWIAE